MKCAWFCVCVALCFVSCVAPKMTLVGGASDGRAVFMGFDFDVPVKWASQNVMHVTYVDRCEEVEVGHRRYRLDQPWQGFGEAVAWGEAKTGVPHGLSFSREEPMSFDWRAWADGALESFSAEGGMALQSRLCKGYDADYVGSAGELKASLSVGTVCRYDGGKLKSTRRVLNVIVHRRDSPIPPLHFDEL